MGIGDGGMDQSALASNKFMSVVSIVGSVVGSIVGDGVSSLILKTGAWGASSKGVWQCYLTCTLFFKMSRGIMSHLFIYVWALQYTILIFGFTSLCSLRWKKIDIT